MDSNSDLIGHELALIATLAEKRLQAVISPVLKSEQLRRDDWLVLTRICQSQDSGIRMSEIAASLNFNLPQVSFSTKQLLNRRLVNQKIDVKDARSYYFKPTVAGQRLIIKLQVNLDKQIRNFLQATDSDTLNSYKQALMDIGSGIPQYPGKNLSH